MNKLSPNGPKIRILLIEDDDHFRNLLSMGIDLKDNMITCGACASGKEAFELIPQLTPDLVLIDLSMPDMNGIEVLRIIRNRWPDLRCMVLSGHKDEHYIQSAKDHGAHGYILKTKPQFMLDAIERGISSLG